MFENRKWIVWMILVSGVLNLATVAATMIMWFWLGGGGLVGVPGLFGSVMLLPWVFLTGGFFADTLRFGHLPFPSEGLVEELSKLLTGSVINSAWVVIALFAGNPTSFSWIIAYFASFIGGSLLFDGWLSAWLIRVKQTEIHKDMIAY